MYPIGSLFLCHFDDDDDVWFSQYATKRICVNPEISPYMKFSTFGLGAAVRSVVDWFNRGRSADPTEIAAYK